MTQLYPDGLTFRVLEVVFAIIAAKLPVASFLSKVAADVRGIAIPRMKISLLGCSDK